MDDQRLRIFNAISSFIQDLDTGFGKRYKPVALYNRLISKTTIRDDTAISRHIKAFETFFNSNGRYVTSKKLNEEAQIKYSDRVYIDIGKILAKIDENDHRQIHKHLVTIFTLMNIGTQEGREALETLRHADPPPPEAPSFNTPDTPEGNFIKNTFDELLKHCDQMDTKDANPMSMIQGMMQSGFFTKLMGDLQTKCSSGEFDVKRLLSTVTESVGSQLPEEGRAEMGNMLSQMSNLTNLAGLIGNLSPEMKGQMDSFLGQMTQPSVSVVDSDEDKDSLSDTPEDDNGEDKK